jgi:hypothetical protein
LKQIERDLIIISLISDAINTDTKKVINNLKNTETHDLFISTFKDEDHLEGIMIKMAQDAYSRVEKKLPKI